MSDYIKREDAIEAVYQGRRKPVDDEWIRILEALNAIPSADVVERERYDRLKRNFKDLSDDYDELTKEVERAEMRGSEE